MLTQFFFRYSLHHHIIFSYKDSTSYTKMGIMGQIEISKMLQLGEFAAVGKAEHMGRKWLFKGQIE
jgi:hypothetical protein